MMLIRLFIEVYYLILNNENAKALRGGGVHPDLFVKLDFEIAVDHQTRARYRTFELLRGSGLRVPNGARGTATPIFGQFVVQFCHTHQI